MAVVLSRRQRNALLATGAAAVAPAVGPALRNLAQGLAEGLPSMVRMGKRQYRRLRAAQEASRTPPPKVVVVEQPVVQLPPKRKAAAPSVDQRSRGGITTITHTDVIGQLVAPTLGTTSIGNYPLAIDSTVTFPWISRIAPNFSQYRFKNVRFHYVPQVGAYGASAVGSIVLAFDPDASSSAALLNSRTQVLNLNGSVEKRLDKEAFIKANSGRLLPWYDVGDNAGSAAQFSDLGLLYVCINGTPTVGGTPLGDLKVEYTVEFRIPRIAPSLNSGYLHAYTATESASATNPLGTNLTTVPASSFPLGAITFSNNTIAFAPWASGTYMVALYWHSSDTDVTTNATCTYGTGVSGALGTLYGNNYHTECVAAADYRRCLRVDFIRYDSSVWPIGNMQYGGMTGLAAAGLDIHIAALPAGMTVGEPLDELKKLYESLRGKLKDANRHAKIVEIPDPTYRNLDESESSSSGPRHPVPYYRRAPFHGKEDD